MLRETKPVIWTLLPYWIDGETVTSDSYDLSTFKLELASAFLELGLPWILQVVVPGNIQKVISQIAECSHTKPVVAFNLCDGYEEAGTPGVSVIKALENAAIPFTGAGARFYQTSCSKLAMKKLFQQHGVPTAAWEVLPAAGPVMGLVERLGQPLFIKPEGSSASQGIGVKSVITSDAQATTRRDELTRGESAILYETDVVIAEHFIDGPEFTVFVGGYWDEPQNLWSLSPAERIFDPSIPARERFLSYDRFWGYFEEETRPAGGGPFCAYQVPPPQTAHAVVEVAKRAFIAVNGTGYGRVDIRFNTKTNEYQVLEVNANCALSGSMDAVCGNLLALSGQRFPQLVERLLDQALIRSGTGFPPSQKSQSSEKTPA